MSMGELNAEDLDALVGRELDGRYLLDRFVDRGGFGAVYRGIDKKFNQPVAVKVGLSYREFMKEAKLAAEVRHDNIVQVSDYGNDNGLAYLVMEFLQGDDLEKLFHRQGNRLTFEQMRMFVSEVGDALAHAHAENLIHRDLKPRNIILKQYQGRSSAAASTGKFVLLDFGIAAKLDAEGTQRNRTQDGAGTLEYMAPELLKVKPTTTPMSDIYAFGVLLYQLLTGRVPYPQSDTSHLALAEIVRAISVEPPPRFADVAPDRKFPPAIEELVLQCLEKDPARRPQTMSEVRDRFLKAFVQPTTKRRSDFSQTIRPGELHDTDEQVVDDQPIWKHTRPEPVPSRGPWGLLTFLLAAGLLVVVAVLMMRPGLQPRATLSVMQDNEEVTKLDEGASLEVTAGDAVTLTFAIDDLPRDVTPEFPAPSVPKGLHVEMKTGPVPGMSKRYVISVPNPNAVAGSESSVTIRAAVPNSSNAFEKTVSLKIRRPQPWLPESIRSLGFEEASDSQLCRLGREYYASVLQRRLAGQTVRMRLIPATEVGDRRIRSFYIMELMVTNALFNEFAKSVAGFEFQPRTQQERVWEAGDDFPVTHVYVLEAQRFAQWFAGKSGSLPTTTEWELSAGYYDFLRVLEARFHLSPWEIPTEELRNFRSRETIPLLNAEVWIGLGPALNEFRDSAGTSQKDCSPYGCRYPRLKTEVWPTELTATLVDILDSEADLRELCRHRMPEQDDKALTENKYHARLRGAGKPNATDEFLWVKADRQELRVRRIEDLNDAGDVSLLPNEIALDSYIGFRVVLPIDAEKK